MLILKSFLPMVMLPGMMRVSNIYGKGITWVMSMSQKPRFDYLSLLYSQCRFCPALLARALRGRRYSTSIPPPTTPYPCVSLFRCVRVVLIAPCRFHLLCHRFYRVVCGYFNVSQDINVSQTVFKQKANMTPVKSGYQMDEKPSKNERGKMK